MKSCRLTHAASGWSAPAGVAETLAERLRGLIGRPDWPSDRALIIPRCAAIHTAFMRRALDVAFLDAAGRVRRTARGLRPWRTAFGGWRATTVVEMAEGTLPASVTAGERLIWE